MFERLKKIFNESDLSTVFIALGIFSLIGLSIIIYSTVQSNSYLKNTENTTEQFEKEKVKNIKEIKDTEEIKIEKKNIEKRIEQNLGKKSETKKVLVNEFKKGKKLNVKEKQLEEKILKGEELPLYEVIDGVNVWNQTERVKKLLENKRNICKDIDDECVVKFSGKLTPEKIIKEINKKIKANKVDYLDYMYE